MLPPHSLSAPGPGLQLVPRFPKMPRGHFLLGNPPASRPDLPPGQSGTVHGTELPATGPQAPGPAQLSDRGMQRSLRFGKRLLPPLATLTESTGAFG